MSARRPATPATYVRVARRLARSAPGGVISAGQVAYHAHRRVANLDGVDLRADRALADSGLFERASFINGRFSNVTLWRAKAGAP